MPRWSGLSGAAADDFDRAGGLCGEGFRDAAHENALGAAAAVGADDEDVGTPIAGFVEDDVFGAIEENGDGFGDVETGAGKDGLGAGDGGLGAGERFFAELLDFAGVEERRLEQGVDGGENDFDDAENPDLRAGRPGAIGDGVGGDFGVGRAIGGEQDFACLHGFIEAGADDGDRAFGVAEGVGGDVAEEEMSERIDAVGPEDDQVWPGVFGAFEDDRFWVPGGDVAMGVDAAHTEDGGGLFDEILGLVVGGFEGLRHGP